MRYAAFAVTLGMLVVAGCGGQQIKIETVRFNDIWKIVDQMHPGGEIVEPGVGVVKIVSDEPEGKFKITVREVHEVSPLTVTVEVLRMGPVHGGRQKQDENMVLKPILDAVLTDFGSSTVRKPKGLD
jgi:hypothetical protein